MLVQVSYNQTTRVALIQVDNAAVPSGSVDIGSFNHPDLVYPDSVVIYHGVRDLLYKRSAANAANTAMFPNNITDMDRISIVLSAGVFDIVPASVTVSPASLAGLNVDEEEQLVPTVLPANSTNKNVTYVSSAPSVATVSATGLVTGVAVGNANITITTVSGNRTVVCAVTVSAP